MVNTEVLTSRFGHVADWGDGLMDGAEIQIYNTRDYGSIILYDFILSLIPFLLTPLLICFLTSLYAYLKARKEQTLQYKSSYPETPRSYEAPRYEAVSGSGMYCPFCGKYTKVKYEFCPHCREKLDFELK